MVIAPLIAKNVHTGQSFAILWRDDALAVVPSTEQPAAGLYVSAGWTDLQVNGFAGYDVNSAQVDGAAITGLVRRLWREGVARLFPTVITQSGPHIERCLRTIADACEGAEEVRASVAGIHLEGPYVSGADGARGAHPREHVRAPDWEEFSRWQGAANGLIRLLTLAPEWPGAPEFIRRVTASGVMVALGHTLADSEQIAEAVDAGAVLSTHLGNGAPMLLPRHPNFLWDQLAEDRLWVSIICDGHHLPANVMRAILRAKGVERTIMVSDSVSLAGMTPGVYETSIGAKVELGGDKRLTMFGSDYLAGSASSLKDGIELAVRLAGCSLAEAVQLASLNPGQFAGLASDRTRTVFRWHEQEKRIEVVATIVDGRLRHRSPEFEGLAGADR